MNTVLVVICLWLVASALFVWRLSYITSERRRFRGSHDEQFLNWRRRHEDR